MGLVDQMTATVFRQSYMTQRQSLFTRSAIMPLCFNLL